MTAPDRIALRWELGAAVTSGPLMDHPDYTRYVRADLARPTPLAVPDDVYAYAIDVSEAFDTMMEVEMNPNGAWQVIQALAGHIAALRAIGEGKA